MSATDSRSGDEYFRQIERTFIRLRGAPLLLSPADWQTARRWYEQGVSLEVVCEVLERVFEKARDRDPKRRISSLSYCAPAVEETWAEIQELTAAAGRLDPDPIDVPARLAVLSASLRAAAPGQVEVIESLNGLSGAAEAVERSLEGLDGRMLDLAEQQLSDSERDEIAGQARSALARTRGGGGTGADPDVERRLYREFVRRRLGLPTLSLFSAAAVDEPE